MSKLNLEYPYNQDWNNGYLVTNSENRKTVILYNSHQNRSSTAYARYLKSVSLGRYLTEDEHVDHRDDDKTNDALTNLQILTLVDNNIKEAKRRGKLVVKIECPSCTQEFSRRRGNSPLVNGQEDRLFCCSRECSYTLKKLPQNERKALITKQRSNLIVYRMFT